MPLNLFASASSLSTPLLDQNFDYFTVVAPIPCLVSGTNDLSLTPNANAAQATVSAYFNYQQFSGIATATSTGAMTGAVAGLPRLPVYKDTIGGPAACSNGELQVSCAFTLIYDSALNGGNGGFHLFTTTAQTSSFINPGTVQANLGSFSTLTGVNTTLTNNSVGSESVGTLTVKNLLSGTALSISSTISSTITNPMVRMLSSSFTLGSIVVGPAGSTDNSITLGMLQGAVPGDAVFVGGPTTLNAGVGLFGFVSAAGTVVMRAINAGSTSVTLAAGTYRLAVTGFTS